MKFRNKNILLASLVLIGMLALASCVKEEPIDPNNPLMGLWSVDRDTYKEGEREMDVTYYDEPYLYFINIKNNGDWIEEEYDIGDEPIVRKYKYQLLEQNEVLCYTSNPSDGFRMKYEVDGLKLVLTEKGHKEVQGVSIPYTYVRYLFK